MADDEREPDWRVLRQKGIATSTLPEAYHPSRSKTVMIKASNYGGALVENLTEFIQRLEIYTQFRSLRTRQW